MEKYPKLVRQKTLDIDSFERRLEVIGVMLNSEIKKAQDKLGKLSELTQGRGTFGGQNRRMPGGGNSEIQKLKDRLDACKLPEETQTIVD